MKSGMRFSVLASGSKGNVSYFETDNAKILIDAGLSCKEIIRRLKLIRVEPEGLDALIITHEHLDHIKGAGPITRRFDLPVYINHKTLEKSRHILGNLPNPVIIDTGQTLRIKDLVIETFTKCHDAADPFGLVLSFNGSKVGLATDLGRSTRLVEDRLKGCNALILEFNYESEMLDNGPYPLFLKRRIKGQDGHLSNRQAADLIQTISHDKLEHVVLAHLSDTNNHPEKANEEAVKVLSKCGLHKTKVIVSMQDDTCPMIDLG